MSTFENKNNNIDSFNDLVVKSPGLKHFYPFDENNGNVLFDKFNLSVNGSYSDTGITHGITAINNQTAVAFDGLNGYAFIDNLNLFLSSFSIQIWTFTDENFIFDKIPLLSSKNFNLKYNSNSSLTFDIITDVNIKPTSISSGPIQDYGWNQIVVTYDKKNLKIYVNGILKNSKNLKGLIYLNNRINIAKDINDNIFGKIILNNLIFWDRSLTSDEILNQYNSAISLSNDFHKESIENAHTYAITYSGSGSGTLLTQVTFWGGQAYSNLFVNANFLQTVPPSGINYRGRGPTDFFATINIQKLNYNQEFLPSYDGYTSFPTSIDIYQKPGSYRYNNGNLVFYPDPNNDLKTSAIMRTPPFNDSAVLKSSVYFYNSIIVTAYNAQTNLSYQSEVTPDGYFIINNLPNGTYQVTPSLYGYKFNPANSTVILNNNNENISFTILNIDSIQNYVKPITYSMCKINSNDATPGTFSIDGYILPDNSVITGSNSYQSILVVITDKNLAQAYQQTLSNG